LEKSYEQLKTKCTSLEEDKARLEEHNRKLTEDVSKCKAKVKALLENEQKPEKV